jgi:xanthine/uracil permease
MIEGLMSVVSGFYGTGHGTTTYGGNIGCIGITKVQ